MEKLIPFINEIHDILHKANLTNELNLPQIVVIGSQSVGKSSLLEGIVGKEFLPRGKGIVTRRPIEIQLIQQHEALGEEKEWFELFERRGEKYYECDEVRKLIELETDKVAGKNKGVSHSPLKIKFHSKNVLDLLLIDLPGLTKNPVGDQPIDIEQKILEIVLPFVKNPNTLILAVSKAHDDLATSEGLKLARLVDPEGLRTIGVITQLDLMDEGSDALNDLLNKTYPLQLGYVGVVMRGSKDIQKNKSIQDQLQDEKQFFENHKTYRKYVEKMGIPYLVKTLNMNFIQSIKRALPVIRETIINVMQIKEFDLKQYGDFENLDTKEAKSYLILTLISKFSHAYKDMLEGKYLNFTSEELIGGSRIIYVFNETYRKTVSKMNPFDILSDDDIRTAIKNANGIRPSLFVPEGAFEILVRQQIARLQLPSLECSHLIYEELRRVLNQISIPEIERFDNLSNNLFDVVESLLHRCLNQTDQMIKNIIDIELGYINTSHPDFVSGMDLIQREDHHHQDQRLKHQQAQQQHQQLNQLQQNQPLLITPQQSEQESHKPLLNFWPFQNNKQNKQTELYDSKLDMMNKKKKKTQQVQSDNEQLDGFSQSSRARQQLNNDYYQNMHFNPEQPKRALPQVPNQIRITEKPTKREQTETDMIKDLIVSYFNVVKKNVNDSVPKTIITFLVNQSRNLCERELIGQLYKADTVDDLLAENQFISKSRAETKKNLMILRNCLNLLNDLDAKF